MSKFKNYRIENVQHVKYNNVNSTFFALYIYNEESNSFIYDHTGKIKGHYKTKSAILSRYKKQEENSLYVEE